MKYLPPHPSLLPGLSFSPPLTHLAPLWVLMVLRSFWGFFPIFNYIIAEALVVSVCVGPPVCRDSTALCDSAASPSCARPAARCHHAVAPRVPAGDRARTDTAARAPNSPILEPHQYFLSLFPAHRDTACANVTVCEWGELKDHWNEFFVEYHKGDSAVGWLVRV